MRDCLENIKATSLRASDVARCTLSFTSGVAGKFEPLNLSLVIKALKGLVEIALSKKAPIVFQLDDRLPAILGNATQLHQLAMNLLLNATEALDNSGGMVRIITSVVPVNSAVANDIAFRSPPKGDALVCLEVADTGPGIDESTRRKLFDPFFSTKSEGRGLGLTVVERIVAAHCGGININSVPGGGTTFQVYFPVADMHALPPPTNAEAVAPKNAGTILVVDDEAIVRTSTKALAETVGYAVLVADGGLDAIEIYRCHRADIDCVVLDLTMPKLDGLQTLVELRRINDKVRVLLTSGGYPVGSLRNHPASSNVIGFLQKPYEFNALLEMLRGKMNVH